MNYIYESRASRRTETSHLRMSGRRIEVLWSDVTANSFQRLTVKVAAVSG